jgi:hypothetical protein
MIKSGSSYRMSKTNKRMLATIVDRQKRGEIKRTVIQADLYGRQFTPRSRDKNQSNSS